MSAFIPVSTATEMANDYINDHESILKTEYQGQNILCNSETFIKAQVQTLLDKEGCVAIRVQYGMDASKKVHAILVAVDENNEAIVPTASNASLVDDSNEYTLEMGQRCPEECPSGWPS
jgi:hypothetical protein